MTREELTTFIKERNKEIENVEIPKIINPIMDLYESGVKTGMTIGEKAMLDEVHTWLADNLPNQIGFVDANIVIQKFLKDMKL